MAITTCDHVDQILLKKSGDDVLGCQDCLEMGSTWVHLRMCLSCGHIGCCDSSEYKHARSHFNTSGHAIIQSVEPGEEWGWCYIDERYFKQVPAPGS